MIAAAAVIIALGAAGCESKEEIIMGVTDRLIRENEITTLMVTHNMNHALSFGNRLLMMHEGKVVEDLKGNDKVSLTTKDVITMFRKNADTIEDRMVLGL